MLLRIVARAVPTPAYLEEGKNQAGAENSRLWGWGLGFALFGTMTQESPNSWFREQEDGGWSCPVMCVLLSEALLAVLEQVLCGGEAMLPSSSTLFHHPQRDLCSS